MINRGLVGIMAVRMAGPRPFAEGGYFRELVRAGRQMGLRVIVFSPLDINWAQGTVLGFTSKPGGGWRVKRYPVPGVVYDRLFPSRSAGGAYWSQARRMRRAFRVTMMGRGLHGKWQMYRILRHCEEIRPHLPTTRLASYQALVAMLRRYDTVFIKPVFGSGGRGIVCVKKVKGGFIVDGVNRPRLRLSSLPAVAASLGRLNRRYLIQQGLNLNYIQGRTFDVRMIVQRNGEGEWQISGKVVRMGRRGNITSNLHTGGRAHQVHVVLERYFREQAQEIEKDMDRLALLVATAMAERAGPLCDLGLDMGVDAGGKVWLIEVNSKPGRKAFRQMGDFEARKRVVMTVMEYARFLVEQRRQRR